MVFPSVIRFVRSAFRALRAKFGGYVVLAPDTVAEERLRVCEECYFFVPDSRQCGRCTCFVDFKVKLAVEECPEGVWRSVWAKR